MITDIIDSVIAGILEAITNLINDLILGLFDGFLG